MTLSDRQYLAYSRAECAVATAKAKRIIVQQVDRIMRRTTRRRKEQSL